MKSGGDKGDLYRKASYSYYDNPDSIEKKIPKHIRNFLDSSTRQIEREVNRGLGKVFGRKRDWVLLLLFTVFLIFFFKKGSVFLLFAGVTGYVKYFVTKAGSPIDFSPLFFFTIIIGAFYGVLFAILFVIIADVIPFILGGGVHDFVGSQSYFMYIFLAWIASFSPENIASIGVALTALNSVGGFILNKFLGTLHSHSFTNLVLNMLLNMFYFIKLAPYLLPFLI